MAQDDKISVCVRVCVCVYVYACVCVRKCLCWGVPVSGGCIHVAIFAIPALSWYEGLLQPHSTRQLSGLHAPHKLPYIKGKAMTGTKGRKEY